MIIPDARHRLRLFAAPLIAGLMSACTSRPPADRVRASGHVEATDVQVAPEVGGRLIELRVAEGDRVEFEIVQGQKGLQAADVVKV